MRWPPRKRHTSTPFASSWPARRRHSLKASGNWQRSQRSSGYRITAAFRALDGERDFKIAPCIVDRRQYIRMAGGAVIQPGTGFAGQRAPEITHRPAPRGGTAGENHIGFLTGEVHVRHAAFGVADFVGVIAVDQQHALLPSSSSRLLNPRDRYCSGRP